MSCYRFIPLLLLLWSSFLISFHVRQSTRLLAYRYDPSNEKRVAKSGRHTYATWSNAKKSNGKSSEEINLSYDDADEDQDQYKDSSFDEDDEQVTKYPDFVPKKMNKNDQASDIYAENGDGSPVLSWLKSAYNALVFYGLDDQVGKSKRLISPLRPSSIKKSPFFTVSESIGQRILQEEAPISSAGKWVGSEEEKDRDDQKGMNNNKGSRFKIRPRSIKRTKYADAIIAQSTLKSVQECEDRLALLAEDLELLDVSIAAAELEDDTNSKIESLLSRRVQLLDDIEETQARLVTLAITELNDSSS